ncbi:ankyrin repeat protein [Seminavis robusta]|uniref:Ankyrin repeat protein n=1 Tax=Seminavis robusta TaxID=568900 RepID=A0A9N8H578_9STRA|nr:ankyrin repeat protein [Seminavis robusta]|eukprot:Sro67_g037820.1 ankyrin repeat protein (247) ;mRNA; r:136824-137564
MSSEPKPKKQKLDAILPALLDQKDVWINSILPFVGMGQYAFVGTVNKKMNHLYKEYCDSVEDPPMVQNHQNGTKIQATSTVTTYSAAFYNKSTAELWLSENSDTKLPQHDTVCTAIAKHGNLRVIQWAYEKGFPWNKDTCAATAKGGHLDFFKWLRENGCPWDIDTCAAAARGGHLYVLKWLCENGCRWDAHTIDFAAEGGHLELLKWAHENGCPWSVPTCAYAAQSGHLELLKAVQMAAMECSNL